LPDEVAAAAGTVIGTGTQVDDEDFAIDALIHDVGPVGFVSLVCHACIVRTGAIGASKR
jgi:hypothetical protein